MVLSGIPMTGFHDLRHTYATLALQQGTDIKIVSSNPRHATAAFTLDTYLGGMIRCGFVLNGYMECQGEDITELNFLARAVKPEQ